MRAQNARLSQTSRFGAECESARPPGTASRALNKASACLQAARDFVSNARLSRRERSSRFAGTPGLELPRDPRRRCVKRRSSRRASRAGEAYRLLAGRAVQKGRRPKTKASLHRLIGLGLLDLTSLVLQLTCTIVQFCHLRDYETRHRGAFRVPRCSTGIRRPRFALDAASCSAERSRRVR